MGSWLTPNLGVHIPCPREGRALTHTHTHACMRAKSTTYPSRREQSRSSSGPPARERGSESGAASPAFCVQQVGDWPPAASRVQPQQPQRHTFVPLDVLGTAVHTEVAAGSPPGRPGLGQGREGSGGHPPGDHSAGLPTHLHGMQASLALHLLTPYEHPNLMLLMNTACKAGIGTCAPGSPLDPVLCGGLRSGKDVAGVGILRSLMGDV